MMAGSRWKFGQVKRRSRKAGSIWKAYSPRRELVGHGLVLVSLFVRGYNISCFAFYLV